MQTDGRREIQRTHLRYLDKMGDRGEVCCIKRPEAILTGNPTDESVSGCLPAVR